MENLRKLIKQNENLKISVFGISIIAISLLLLNLNTINHSESSYKPFPQGYRIVTPPIPENPEFCGEPVRVENFDIRERLEREIVVNTYWHSATVLMLKRANRWFPVIEPILEKNGIPNDFKYLALIESGFQNVESPAGALGFWQFLEHTGKKKGLEITREVDERYNVEKSTEAACRYLNEAYDSLGTWTLAAASYNMGLDGVLRQLERQKANSYYNLVLNNETSRYMFRIIAVKEIFKDPSKYGFDISEDELYPPIETKTVKLDSSVDHFADWAQQYGLNYKTLKDFNPWLRYHYLHNEEGKVYEIKIPKEGEVNVIK